MRWTRGVLMVGALACSNSSPVAPPVQEPEVPVVPAPAPGVVAQYGLVLVNGAPPPSASPIGAGEWDYDGAKYLLESATLSLHENGTFVEYWIHRRTPGNDLVSQECIGRYTKLSASTLQVGSGAGATLMTLTATGLVWHLPGFSLTYDRQK